MSTSKELPSALRQMSAAFGARWQQLPARDRMALHALWLCVAAVAIWLCLWQPVQRSLHAARAAVVSERELLEHIRSHGAQAVSSVAKRAIAGGGLQALAAHTAASRKLDIARIEQRGAQQLQVELPRGAPAEVIEWLLELQEYGVIASEVSMAPVSGGGWRTRLVLSRSGG